ncbi:MAG: transposase [Myxococcota bacterium]|jgi:transposase-like protein|nr:transposase [Myxococcota bacterium]
MNNKHSSISTSSPPGAPAAEVSPDSTASDAGALGERPDPEVPARPRRRRFSAEYKLRVLEELDRAEPGEQGAILRREGLYSSHLTEWRRARRRGALGSLGVKRGPKPKPDGGQAKRIAKLERELARTKEELRRAHLILEVQGKVAGLLGIDLSSGKDS